MEFDFEFFARETFPYIRSEMMNAPNSKRAVLKRFAPRKLEATTRRNEMVKQGAIAWTLTELSLFRVNVTRLGYDLPINYSNEKNHRGCGL